jgi:hypothetical protein
MTKDMANSTPAVTLFDSREQARELALSLVQQAKRQVCFFGSSLDTVLFDNLEFVESLSLFARRSHRAVAKFIVHDTQQNTANGHRLLPLAQQLTSSIFIRTSCQQHRDLKQYFMLVDNKAYLYGQYSTRYNGRAHFDDMAETRQLQQLFNTIWDQGQPDVQSRRLQL